MKNIYRLIFILGLVSNLAFSQNDKVFVVDDKNDYVLLLDADIKTSTLNQPNTEIDTYIKQKDGIFQYTIVLSKATNHGFENGNLIEGKYDKEFKDSCGCEVYDTDLIICNNLKLLRHFFIAKRGEKVYKGINASFVSDKYLFTLIFMTFEKDFDSQKDEFTEILNTLMINGKTTVDSF